MAFSTFGVTAATLQSDLLPQYTLDASSRPTSTRVAEIINRRAAKVSGLVDALGIDSSGLDSDGEPIAYYYCQRLVMVGAAADVAAAFAGRKPADGLVETWRSEWREGCEDLAGPRAKALLRDAITASSPLIMRTHIQHGSDRPSAAGDIEIADPAFVRDMDL